jgi:tRNA(Arg) A34 adenosine deaminase TadA
MPEVLSSPFACCCGTIAHQRFSRILVLHQNPSFKVRSTTEKCPYKQCAS